MKLVREYLDFNPDPEHQITLRKILKFPEVPELQFKESGKNRDHGDFIIYSYRDLEVTIAYDKHFDELYMDAWKPTPPKAWYSSLRVKEVSSDLESARDQIKIYLDTIEDYKMR